MIRQAALVLLILLIAVLGACSTESPPPTTQAPARETPAAPAPVPAPAPPAAPPPAAVLKTGDSNTAGVAADVVECRRKEGVLSVRVRFRNTGSEKIPFTLIDARNYEKYYVTATSKKYFILKDTEGTYLTAQASGFGNLSVNLAPGGQYTWWAKYPAPPAEVKAVTLYTPVSPPFEDIPISDQ